MGWLDALAGGLQGASQGFGQVQDMRQTQLRNKQQEVQLQMQQKQQEAQMAEQKRAAVADYYNRLRPGVDAVDPTKASELAGMGYSLEKTAQGGLVKPKSKQDMLVDLQFENDQAESTMRREKMAFLGEIHNAGSDFFQQPLKTRLTNALKFGLKQGDVMTPDEQLQFNSGYRGQQVAAATRNYDTPLDIKRFELDQRYKEEQTAANRVKERNDFAIGIAKDINGIIDQKKLQAAYQQYDTVIAPQRQQGQPQGQPAQVARTGGGPAVGTRGSVNGIPAVWDGKNWIG